ncbi:hypothetical protein K458DRAFT_381262 [Lentithecium fluviatile CBS 122367]|uniref:Uncharacterized protein n=1 Tax=Lentithecium fluviatile CBS 122367 TaxID=1168545 RepID=A0A6G1JMM2_9PLEO|nr:hypothetical protein K458DRAFT_381262 [Lentithecium fluviatile CBS 122367]
MATSSSDGCSFYPNFTWDSSFCWSAGPPTEYAENVTFYTRYFNISTIGTFNSEPVTGFEEPTTSDFDRCLPGPTTCDLTYTGGSCPQSYSAVYQEAEAGVTTEYCCPSEQQTTGDERGVMEKSELPGESLPRHDIAKEAFSAPVFEMADTSGPTELGEGEKEKEDGKKDEVLHCGVVDKETAEHVQEKLLKDVVMEGSGDKKEEGELQDNAKEERIGGP